MSGRIEGDTGVFLGSDTLRGQPIIVLDANLGPRDHVATLAQALGTFDLDAIYLPPLVRATIHAHGKVRVLAPRPLARVKPDAARR